MHLAAYSPITPIFEMAPSEVYWSPLRQAMQAGLPMHLIHGNNLGDATALHNLSVESGGRLRYYGADARLALGGRRVFVVHYPDYGYAMACTGEWDLVCCGHSHHAAIEHVANVKGGKTWLVNPGTVAGLAAPATWIMGHLDEMRFQIRQLGPRPGASHAPRGRDRLNQPSVPAPRTESD